MIDKQAQRARAAQFAAEQLAKGVEPPPPMPVPVRKRKGPADMQGTELAVGMRVARPYPTSSGGAKIEIRTVTSVTDGKVRLDGSSQNIRHPERLLVIGV